MKAYLVNAADPVLTVSIEFGIRETDPARAASIIVEHMKACPNVESRGGFDMPGCRE